MTSTWNARDPVADQLATAQDRARSTLAGLPPGSRDTAVILYAAAAAERLFRWYDVAPEDERLGYSLTWRPVLADVWAHVSGDDAAHARVCRSLGEFYLSPYSSNEPNGPDDIDQDEAAATYFAANCVVHGLVDFALLATARATDHLDTLWFGKDEARRQREISAELSRQQADLSLIVAALGTPGPGLNADLIANLRR